MKTEITSFQSKGIDNRDLPDEVAKKNGKIWRLYAARENRCANPDKHPGSKCPGRIYSYVLRKKFHDPTAFERKTAEIFPAIEANYDTISANMVELNKLCGKFQLGFAASVENGRYLCEIPDREVLEHNLRSQANIMQWQLKYASGKGRATDRAFIEASLLYDGMIDECEEAKHDMTVHIMNELCSRFLMQKRYDAFRNKDRAIFRKVLANIDQLEGGNTKKKMETLLAIFMDRYTTMLSEYLSGGMRHDLYFHFDLLVQRREGKAVKFFEELYGPLTTEEIERIGPIWKALMPFTASDIGS